jgi:SAM-dependent methyltransferase
MNNIIMRRKIGDEYETYEHYIDHQKEKTNDIRRRKLWLGKEWKMKIDIFKNVFKFYKDEKILKDDMKCLCFGARTGQEVVALNDIGMDALGIDIVPQEPYVIKGDIHDAPFPDKSFDFVFTNIIDHSINPQKFISEIERVLKSGGHALVQLQLNCKSDEYAENDVYNSKSVINLFNDSEVVIDREIPFTLSMNWEFLMKKT